MGYFPISKNQLIHTDIRHLTAIKSRGSISFRYLAQIIECKGHNHENDLMAYFPNEDVTYPSIYDRSLISWEEASIMDF